MSNARKEKVMHQTRQTRQGKKTEKDNTQEQQQIYVQQLSNRIVAHNKTKKSYQDTIQACSFFAKEEMFNKILVEIEKQLYQIDQDLFTTETIIDRCFYASTYVYIMQEK